MGDMDRQHAIQWLAKGGFCLPLGSLSSKQCDLMADGWRHLTVTY